MGTNIELDQKKIIQFCRQNHVKRLSLFGSVVRADFRPESDVDVLIEFQPGHTPGLGFFRMEEELSQLFGRRVDLNTPNFMSPLIRQEILHQAEIKYDAA